MAGNLDELIPGMLGLRSMRQIAVQLVLPVGLDMKHASSFHHLNHAAGTSHVQVYLGFSLKSFIDYPPLVIFGSFLFLSCSDLFPARVCFVSFFLRVFFLVS